jgi:hypothetical protein
MGASIQDMYEKLKGLLDDDVYFYAVLIVLVGIISFGLGRWSIQDVDSSQQAQIMLTTEPVSVTVGDSKLSPQPERDIDLKLVASKNGTKYHLPTCPGAKQMNEDNKIYFNNKEEAKAAGYTPAANCKGL